MTTTHSLTIRLDKACAMPTPYDLQTLFRRLGPLGCITHLTVVTTHWWAISRPNDIQMRNLLIMLGHLCPRLESLEIRGTLYGRTLEDTILHQCWRSIRHIKLDPGCECPPTLRYYPPALQTYSAARASMPELLRYCRNMQTVDILFDTSESPTLPDSEKYLRHLSLGSLAAEPCTPLDLVSACPHLEALEWRHRMNDKAVRRLGNTCPGLRILKAGFFLTAQLACFLSRRCPDLSCLRGMYPHPMAFPPDAIPRDLTVLSSLQELVLFGASECKVEHLPPTLRTLRAFIDPRVIARCCPHLEELDMRPGRMLQVDSDPPDDEGLTILAKGCPRIRSLANAPPVSPSWSTGFPNLQRLTIQPSATPLDLRSLMVSSPNIDTIDCYRTMPITAPCATIKHLSIGLGLYTERVNVNPFLPRLPTLFPNLETCRIYSAAIPQGPSIPIEPIRHESWNKLSFPWLRKWECEVPLNRTCRLECFLGSCPRLKTVDLSMMRVTQCDITSWAITPPSIYLRTLRISHMPFPAPEQLQLLHSRFPRLQLYCANQRFM